MNSVLVLGASVGVMVALAGVLTLLDRYFGGGPIRATRRRRLRLRLRRVTRSAAQPARTADDAPPRRAMRVRRAAPPVSSRRPLQSVAADLRRLARELAAVPAGAPYVRWQALQNAYDRVLTEAAELLEVPHALADAPMGPSRDVERLRVVCTLEAAGLVVQD